MSKNPFLERLNHQGTQSKAFWGSKKQEKSIAGMLRDARLVSGSGSGTTKGDVRARGIARIEAKLTSADSFRVTKDMLRKIQEAALVNDEIPAIVVGFLGPNGQQDPNDQVIILPISALKLLQTFTNDGSKT